MVIAFQGCNLQSVCSKEELIANTKAKRETTLFKIKLSKYVFIGQFSSK